MIVSGPISEYETDSYGLSVAHPCGGVASFHRKKDFRPGTKFKEYILVPGRVVASKLPWKDKTLVSINAHNFALTKNGMAVAMEPLQTSSYFLPREWAKITDHLLQVLASGHNHLTQALTRPVPFFGAS